MGAVLRVYAVDLVGFRSMLGSGEEAFCAKVLRGIPEAAERRGLAKDPELVKEWKRSVTGLVLGLPGEALSGRLPFEKTDLTLAGPGLALAFASVLEGYAREGLGGPLPLTPQVAEELVHRPLFGLDSDRTHVSWGAMSRHELKSVSAHPLVMPIRAAGVDLVGLSGPSWTD
jgi:hypothetical protein